MISEADDKQLQQWLSEDRYARDTWNDLVREAGSLDVDQFMENTDPQRDLFALKESLSPRRSGRLYSWQTIAAGLLLAAAGFYFINFSYVNNVLRMEWLIKSYFIWIKLLQIIWSAWSVQLLKRRNKICKATYCSQ